MSDKEIAEGFIFTVFLVIIIVQILSFIVERWKK